MGDTQNFIFNCYIKEMMLKQITITTPINIQGIITYTLLRKGTKNNNTMLQKSKQMESNENTNEMSSPYE